MHIVRDDLDINDSGTIITAVAKQLLLFATTESYSNDYCYVLVRHNRSKTEQYGTTHTHTCMQIHTLKTQKGENSKKEQK